MAVVEKGRLGGTCLNRGCIPSKMLLYRADVLETIERAESFGISATVTDVCEDPQAPAGRPGAGIVHHVAFQVIEDDQPAWRELLREHGLRSTEIIDRKWFKSVYVRTKGGVLFEFATKSPGYAVDEDRDELGERLVLSEWLEDRREETEAGLPPLPTGGE